FSKCTGMGIPVQIGYDPYAWSKIDSRTVYTCLEQLQKFLTLFKITWVPSFADHPAAPLMMIDYHYPVIHTDGHIRHWKIINSNLWQVFDASAEVVGKVTQRTTAKRQTGKIVTFPTQQVL